MKNLKNAIAVVMLMSLTSLALSATAEEPSASGNTVVNLNTASVQELTYLPGIGKSKAEAIIEYRSKNPFKKVADLMKVKGIGRKTFNKIEIYLTLEGQTTAKSKIKPTK